MGDSKNGPRTFVPRVAVSDVFDVSIAPWVDVNDFESALGLPLAQEQLDYPLFEEWLNIVDVDPLRLDCCAGANVPAITGSTPT